MDEAGRFPTALETNDMATNPTTNHLIYSACLLQYVIIYSSIYLIILGLYTLVRNIFLFTSFYCKYSKTSI